ncbi:MAG: baseplate J/gp47 family protein [Azospirillaceae bacterium]|nr:baseplate J/gp47 family protein [Azospirillaceae bacterium]
MSFQIKDFLSIVASMINYMRGATDKISDYNVGSVARTLIEAPAIEIDQLYQQMLFGLRDAIPAATYLSFDFPALAAGSAYGFLQFSLSAAATTTMTIPAGTQAQNSAGTITYATNADAVIPIGATSVEVLATATTTGSAANVDADSLTVLMSSLSGVSVTNPAAITTGTDAETDDARKTRFVAYVTNLARGTGSAILYGAKTAQITNSAGQVTEYVKYCGLVEPYVSDHSQPVGQVNVYIHNGSGGTSAALVALAQQIIDGYYDASGTPVPGYKAAGVICTVAVAPETAVTVTGTLSYTSGATPATVAAAAVAAINSYITGLDIGVPVLLAEVIALVMAVSGVSNVSLSTPTADVVIAGNAKAMPGTVTLS